MYYVVFFYPWNATPAFDVSARPPPANPVPEKSSVRKDSNRSEKTLTFTFQLKDVLLFELSAAYDTLLGCPYKSICTSLTGNVRTRFCNYEDIYI
jgi:hypothetical protein